MELRHDLRLSAQCTVSFASGPVSGEAEVLDLSTGGWLIASEKTIPQGKPLLLRVSLPDGGEPLEVELATVQWSQGGRFGLKNLIMGESEWKRIQRFVVNLVKPSDLCNARTT